SIIGAFHENASATVSRLVEDIRDEAEAAIADLKKAKANEEKDPPALAQSLRELETLDVDTVLEEPITASNIKDKIWNPLRKALEGVWELVETRFRAIVKEAESQAKGDTEKVQDLKQREKQFQDLVGEGDIDRALKQLFKIGWYGTQRVEEEKGLYETFGVEIGKQKALYVDRGSIMGAAAAVLSPIIHPVRIAESGQIGSRGQVTPFELPPRQWDFARQREALTCLEKGVLWAIAVASGWFLFAPEFVGGMKDVATVVAWGFTIDLSVRGVLSQVRAAK
ncbi:MAG TPA: hypothetical protein VJY33_00375, partial [Isosphaeraceae bacterium]|nr:hypothetical protein [Isosphaeraceae bacterium]